MDANDFGDKKQDNADMAAFHFLDFFDFNPLDEMGSRIDELEQSINDLRTEMDADKPPSPVAPSGPKNDSKSTKEP
ncbi:hypothetical protein V6N12_020071 [Hibiscus sabdariffa]|uniref:Heat shock factor binding protein n=1 Tax=Hibiscus sabdariffa TaxID=183260 RepID=A0ABR2ARU0_9ROSI